MGRGVSFVSQARFQFFQHRPDRPDWERELHYVALENSFCTRTVYLLTRTAGLFLSRPHAGKLATRN